MTLMRSPRRSFTTHLVRHRWTPIAGQYRKVNPVVIGSLMPSSDGRQVAGKISGPHWRWTVLARRRALLVMMKEPLFESSNIHSTPSFRQAMDSIHFNTEYKALRFTVVRFQFSTGGFPLNFSSFTVFSGQGLRKLPRGSSRSSLSERPPDAGQNIQGMSVGWFRALIQQRLILVLQHSVQNMKYKML